MNSRHRQRIKSTIDSYTRASPAAMSAYWLTAQIQAYERVLETLAAVDEPEAVRLVNTMLALARTALADQLAGKSPG